MQFGLVLRPDQKPPHTTGIDYLEPDARSVIHPHLPDGEFSVPDLALPVRAVHSLVPASLPITGPNVELSALRLHVQGVCERASQLGVRVITLSSPAALRFPEGFDPKQAKSQVLEFLRTAVPFFARYELMLAAGVNSSDETNVMTSLPEVLQYVWQVDHSWFQCLLDLNMVSAGLITMEQVKDALPWVRHVYAPGPADNLLSPFAELKRANYADRMSLDVPPDSDVSQSVASLRRLWTRA